MEAAACGFELVEGGGGAELAGRAPRGGREVGAAGEREGRKARPKRETVNEASLGRLSAPLVTQTAAPTLAPARLAALGP